MKNKEEIDNSSLDTKEIPQPEKKYIITSIILLSFLIIVFLVLIAEAYLNQHPVFSFLQYSVFKYESISIGSISIFIFFTGILFLGLALGLLLLPISRYKQIAFNIFSYTFDELGRKTQISIQDGTNTRTTNYSYDSLGLGKLDKLTDGSGNLIIDYDYHPLTEQLAKETNGNGTYTTYTYDLVSNTLLPSSLFQKKLAIKSFLYEMIYFNRI